MPAANDLGRRSFDTGASADAQSQFEAVAAHLESLIDRRTQDVAAARADYLADGASEEYAAKEQRWANVAGEVKGIIRVLRGSLASNDDTAALALGRAKAAVDGIG